MPTIGPYQLLHALASCPAGEVWAAADASHNQVTVAVLKPEAASDPALRDAFAAAAGGLAQSGQLPIIAGDFLTTTPWIATVADDGSVAAQVFVAIGIPVQPVGPSRAAPGQPPADTGSDATQAVVLPPAPTYPYATFNQPGSAPPAPPPGTTASVPPAEPVSPPPPAPAYPPAAPSSAPVSVPPQFTPVPASGPPAPPHMPGWSPPFSEGSPHDYPPVVLPDEPPRRRSALVILSLVLGVVVLAGGGGALAFVLRPDDSGEPDAAGGNGPAASPSTPQAFPSQPGLEPPVEGEWPPEWTGFADDDATTTMAGLTGVGFEFDVPEGWECVGGAAEGGAARYACGPGGDASQIGGELIVRECPDPCDSDARVTMRRAEEAWGLRWNRDGGYRSFAHAEELNGEPRYGFVFVGYARSTDEGRLDRQVVFRFTAPVADAELIRKVATSVRDAIR
jgi:hypothetical protein